MKLVNEEKLKRKSRKKRKGDSWEIDFGSDFPVHEKYTKEEPIKE